MTRKVLPGLALASVLTLGCDMFKSDHSRSTNTPVRGERAVAMRNVPDAVDAAFRRDHPAATVNHVEKTAYANGATGYRIDYTTSEGKSGSIEYNASGERAN